MIRVLLVILRILFWLLLLRLLVRAVARAFAQDAEKRRRAASGSSRPEVRAPEDLVLDRVCHTHVPRSRALVARVDGRQEHFCSAACRDKARATVPRAS